MKKIVVAGVLLILLIAGGIVWCTINTTGGDTLLINQKKLMSATKRGEVTLLTEMGEFNQQLVCVLYPYANSVSQDTPQAEKINQYLRSINYIGDEDYWSLIFVDDVNVSITTFKNSKIPILKKYHLNDKDKVSIPAGFEQATWAESNHAAFFKLCKNNRDYLIFGRD